MLGQNTHRRRPSTVGPRLLQCHMQKPRLFSRYRIIQIADKKCEAGIPALQTVRRWQGARINGAHISLQGYFGKFFRRQKTIRNYLQCRVESGLHWLAGIGRQCRHRRPGQNTHIDRNGNFAMTRQRKIKIINPRRRRRQIGKRGAYRKPIGKIGKPFMRVERFFIQLNRQGHFFNLTGAHLAKNLQS